MVEIRDNKDFAEHLESWLVNYESDDLEFKSAVGGFPGSFWDTYSAFANSDGGVIVLGVSEKKGVFYLDGLTDEQIKKYTIDFWNNVNNRSTISCNLLKNDDLRELEYKGYKFLLFNIPRAPRDMRPVYRTTQPYGGTYKRNNEGDYRCTEKEVRRMFADADDQHPADSRILKNYSMADIDTEALMKFRQLLKLSSPDHPWLSFDDIEFLRMLGGYRKDRQTGEEGFTLAGLLMFGKTRSVTEVEGAPNVFPDYQEHLTEDEDVRWTNRICADGTWEANLFNFYQRVLPRLQSVLPKPYKLENNIRRNETPAHVAVREALINLCQHADYSVDASLIVRHNSNGFVFSNPGTLLVSKDQYYTGGESVCRNKALQKMFAIIGVAEKAGSGTDKIMKGWRDANWRSPNVEETLEPDKVVLSMPMETLLSENAKVKLEEKFGIAANSFDHDVLSVLALTCDEGYVTNERLRYTLDMHKAEISELLKRMVTNGLLEPQGYGRGMRYYLPKESKWVLGANTANMVTSGANMVTSGANMVTSGANVATSGANVVTSGANVVTSGDVGDVTIKKRMKPEELDNLIINLCNDWIALEELATLSGRTSKYLRDKILPRLLAWKQIEMLYPGTPNHPRQKYKIKD